MDVDKSNEDMVGCLPDQMDSLPEQMDSLPEQVHSLPEPADEVNSDERGVENNLNVDETDVVHPTKFNMVGIATN